MVLKKLPFLQQLQLQKLKNLNKPLTAKNIGKPQPEQPFNPGQPKSLPTESSNSNISPKFPVYNPKKVFDEKGGMTFTSADKNFSLTPEESKQYGSFSEQRKLLKGVPSETVPGKDQWQVFWETQSPFLSPNVKSLLDYEAVQGALIGEDMKNVPEGISDQTQLDLLLKEKKLRGMDMEELIKAIAAREAAKPVEKLQSAENPAQQAGFIGSSIAGEAGTLATIGGGLVAAGAVPTPATPALLAAGGFALAVAAGKGWLASKSKTQVQDITTARSANQFALKQLNVIQARSADPNADADDVLKDYYAYKRTIYAAEAMLSDNEAIDKINVDQALDELARIKLWMANEEDSLDTIILSRLNQGGDPAAFAAEAPIAAQAFNDLENQQ